MLRLVTDEQTYVPDGGLNIRAEKPGHVWHHVEQSIGTEMKVPAAPRALYEPEDDPGLMWHYSAKTPLLIEGGRTFLDSRLGDAPALAAKDALEGTQPILSTQADGLPSLHVSDFRYLLGVADSNVAALNFTVWSLARPTGVSNSALAALYAILYGAAGNGLQIDSNSTSQFLARVNAHAPYANAVPGTPTDWLSQWILSALDVTPTGLTLTINGAVYASATWTAIVTPPTLGKLALGINRGISKGAAQDFAAHLLRVNPTPEIRQRTIDWFKRSDTWGSRVTGW